MPVYDYLCTACDHRADILHGRNDPGPNFCPSCGGEGTMRKQFAAPAVHFKGSGWAKKDRSASSTGSKTSRSGGGKSESDGESEGGGKSESDGKSASDSKSGSDGKSGGSESDGRDGKSGSDDKLGSDGKSGRGSSGSESATSAGD